MAAYKFHYNCFAFVICNGAMAICLIYGYSLYYSDSNNCDDLASTAFLSSVMFIILFIGYMLGFVYLMLLCTVPCLYVMIRDQAEQTRLNAGGVG
jgi:hypothetical protein